MRLPVSPPDYFKCIKGHIKALYTNIIKIYVNYLANTLNISASFDFS